MQSHGELTIRWNQVNTCRLLEQARELVDVGYPSAIHFESGALHRTEDGFPASSLSVRGGMGRERWHVQETRSCTAVTSFSLCAKEIRRPDAAVISEENVGHGRNVTHLLGRIVNPNKRTRLAKRFEDAQPAVAKTITVYRSKPVDPDELGSIAVKFFSDCPSQRIGPSSRMENNLLSGVPNARDRAAQNIEPRSVG